MPIVQGVVQSEFLPPFVRGLRGVQNFTEKLTKKFWSLGGLLSLVRPKYQNLDRRIALSRHSVTYFRKNQICICYGYPWGLATFLVPENFENL